VCEGAFDARPLWGRGGLAHRGDLPCAGLALGLGQRRPNTRLALDADAAGEQQWCALARQAAMRGKCVAVLPAAAYGRHKDVHKVWVAGTLAVGA